MTRSPSFTHHALIYASVGDLVDAAVPFLSGGLAVGQRAVLVAPPEPAQAILTAMGRYAPVRVVDPGEVYTGPARTVAAFRRLALDGGTSRPGVRMVSSVPAGGPRGAWRDLARYEAVANVALAPLSLSCICAYDGRNLPGEVRALISRTHPVTRTRLGARANPGFTDPATYVRTTTWVEAEPAELSPPYVDIPAITGACEMQAARSAVRDVLAVAQVGRLVAGDFTAAVGELLANAVQHGRPPVQVRLWITPDKLVCTVRDRGRGFDDPLAGYIPPFPDGRAGAGGHGAGLWVARQTCDRLDARADGGGFSVRAVTFLDRDREPAAVAGARARAELASRRVQAARNRAANMAGQLWQQQYALARRQDREKAAADRAAELLRRSAARTDRPPSRA